MNKYSGICCVLSEICTISGWLWLYQALKLLIARRTALADALAEGIDDNSETVRDADSDGRAKSDPLVKLCYA